MRSRIPNMSSGFDEHLWLIYALGAFLMFGITNFLLKVASSRGVPSMEGTVILWASTGLIGLLALLVLIATGRLSVVDDPEPIWLNFRGFVIPMIAGITLAVGMYFLKVAVATGRAGPSTAVAASNAALVALLSWLLLNERLTLSEVFGMILYIAAIAFFALKPVG